ncbi:MAG: M3 family metallopeptidase [bacterium]
MRYGVKYSVIALFLLCFVSCFQKGAQVMTMNDYQKLVEHELKTPADITSLFPKSVEQIKSFAAFSKELARTKLGEMLNIPAQQRTFDNTALALDQLQDKYSRLVSILSLLHHVSPDKDIRETSLACEVELSQYSVDLFLNPDLYKAFDAYINNAGKTESLKSEQRYYLAESVKDFKRAGLHLPEAELVQVRAIKKEISQIEADFDSNISADKSKLKVALADLVGVDEHMLKNLPREGDLFVLGCDYPTYHEILENCQVSATREKMSIMFKNRAFPQNQVLLQKLAQKRYELARKLGFESFAALDTDSAMAQKSGNVDQFLKGLSVASQVKWELEWSNLIKDLPKGVNLADKEGSLNAWDYAYVLETYKKKHFNIDERVIAEYFPVEKALKGMLDVYQDFFGLKFDIVRSDWSWHNDVQLLQITDKETQELLGYIFLDLYPRDDKYSHACIQPMVSTHRAHGVSVPFVGTIIANFPKPTADRPALLKFDDVQTFFHEFGHAMHAVLGKTQLASCSGLSVKTDFVEAPSQMFEEWMYDKHVLARISSHYKTGEPMPGDIIDKKIALKQLDSGFFVARQCLLAAFSLNIFEKLVPQNLDLFRKDLYSVYNKHIAFDERDHFQASFGHLSGYGAKYYSYLWSKVFALDLFDEIKKQGLGNPETGKKFRQLVLGKGGSADPNMLIQDFLGRQPTQDAFLREMGLIKA